MNTKVWTACLALLPTLHAASPGSVLEAVKLRDAALVRALVKQKAAVDVPDADGATPLLIASHLGDADTAARHARRLAARSLAVHVRQRDE